MNMTELYWNLFGIDVSGDCFEEDILFCLFGEMPWLISHRGTRQCIEKICEICIGEKPVIIEKNLIDRYTDKPEETYNLLYGESPYDVTLLVRSDVEMKKRQQLTRLIDQLKPIRCTVSVVFLQNQGVLDGYNYMDCNAVAYTNTSANLDEEYLPDEMMVLE